MQVINVPKLLVVDKSIFHSLCFCEKKLCEFVKNYNVVLPHTLAIECVISENQSPDKDPRKLLKRFDAVIKAGANIGYQSPELLKAEKMTICPIKSVVDEDSTLKLRNSTLEIGIDSIKQGANHCIEISKQKINELLDRAKTLYETIIENKNLMKKLFKPTKREDRFNKWIQIIDHNNIMNNAVKAFFTEQISSHTDANWYTWHYTRLWFAYFFDWSYKKSLPGSCVKKDISNDFYDIEPILYLSRADGLLTNDKKLQIPLAKAAFPQKEEFKVETFLSSTREVQDIFDDINNVIPQSYRIK